LNTIYNQLKGYTFPTGNRYEKHNSSCYKDFLNYLQKFVDNDDEVRYVDYRFTVKLAENPQLQFEEKLAAYAQLKTSEAHLANMQQFKERIEAVLGSFDEQEHHKMYTLLLKTDMALIERDFARHNHDALVTQTREALAMHRFID